MNSTLIVIGLTILTVLNLMILISVLYSWKKTQNLTSKIGFGVIICTLICNMIYIVGGMF